MVVSEKTFKEITGKDPTKTIKTIEFDYVMKYVLGNITSISDTIFKGATSIYPGSITDKIRYFLKSICNENISIYDIDNTVKIESAKYKLNGKIINIYILNSDYYSRDSLSEYGYVFDYNDNRINIFILDEMITDDLGWQDFFALSYQLTEKIITDVYCLNKYNVSSNNQDVMIVVPDEIRPYYKNFNSLFITWYYFTVIYNMVRWFGSEICIENMVKEDLELPITIPKNIIDKIIKYLMIHNDSDYINLIKEIDSEEFISIVKIIEDDFYA